MGELAPIELLRRGVWRAPYLVEGYPALIAVDRHGVARKHVKIRPGVNIQRATDWLHDLLDRLDPPVQLRLVKSPAPASARMIDPRLYSDPRSPLAKQRYIQRLARAAARKAPSPRLEDC